MKIRELFEDMGLGAISAGDVAGYREPLGVGVRTRDLKITKKTNRRKKKRVGIFVEKP